MTTTEPVASADYLSRASIISALREVQPLVEHHASSAASIKSALAQALMGYHEMMDTPALQALLRQARSLAKGW